LSFLDWEKKFSTDDTKIDDQHQKWIGYLNELHEATQDGRSVTDQLEILDNFVIYTRYHFASEESFLKRVDYPEIDELHRIHVEMAQKVLAEQKRIVAEQHNIGLEFLCWLRAWIVGHLVQDDSKYARYLARQPREEPELAF